MCLSSCLGAQQYWIKLPFLSTCLFLMNLIILNATFIFNRPFSFPAIYQDWPEVVVCVQDMHHLLMLHYGNGDGRVVNGNLKFL